MRRVYGRVFVLLVREGRGKKLTLPRCEVASELDNGRKGEEGVVCGVKEINVPAPWLENGEREKEVSKVRSHLSKLSWGCLDAGRHGAEGFCGGLGKIEI